MGKVKLTLSVEKDLIIKAKQIAHLKKQSLSNVFEKLLADNFISKYESLTKTKGNKLRGIAKSPLSLKTDDEIREIMTKEKYGV